MKLFRHFALIFCLVLETTALSGEITQFTVSSLTRVLEEVDRLIQVHPADSMAFLADWDEFLTSENGGNLPREETTAAVLNQIASRIRVGVLTARGAGDENFREIAIKATQAMYAGLLASSPKKVNALTLNPALKPGPFEFTGPTIQQRSSQDPEVDSPHRVIHTEPQYRVKFPRSPYKPEKHPNKTYPLFLAANNIAFVGNPIFCKMKEGSLKGIAAKTLIDEEHFVGARPTVLLFGDNDFANIIAMRKAFKNRPEKLVLFYFPFEKQSPALKPTTQLDSAEGDPSENLEPEGAKKRLKFDEEDKGQ